MEQVIPEQVKEGEAEHAPVQSLVVLIHREEVQEGEVEKVQLQLHLPSARKAVSSQLATARQAHRSPAVPLAAPKFQAAQPGHRPHSMLSFLLLPAVAGSFSKDLFSELLARGLVHPRDPQELECPLPLSKAPRWRLLAQLRLLAHQVPHLLPLKPKPSGSQEKSKQQPILSPKPAIRSATNMGSNPKRNNQHASKQS